MFKIFQPKGRLFNGREQKIASFLAAAKSFEEALFHLISGYLTIKAVGFLDETPQVMCFTISDSGTSFSRNPPEPVEVMAVALITEVTTKHRWQPISKAIHTLADDQRVIVNEEWMDNRAEKLRIKVDSWAGEVVAPANSAVPILLSYITTNNAMVTISNKIVALQPVPVANVAEFKLEYAPPNCEQMLHEIINIRLDLLQRKVEGTRRTGLEKRMSL